MSARRLSRLGNGTRGVWTRRQAIEASSRGTVQHLLDAGVWQVVWPGVLADAGYELDRFQRCQAVSLAAGPGGAGAGRTAARVWQLPLVDDRDPATGAAEHLLDDAAVLNQRVTRTMPDGRRLLPRRLALAEDECQDMRGMQITPPLRTLWDLAGLISHPALVCALDDALHRELVSPEALRAQAVSRAGHPGAPAFAAAVLLADGRAESPLETLGRLLLLQVIPRLVPQVQVRSGGTIVARLDLADEAVRFGIEADGLSVHGQPQAVAKDRKRIDVLAGERWAMTRYTWYDARCEQQELIARVLRDWKRAGGQ